MKVHISKGSGKLLDIDSISTNTLTNEFCQKQHNKKTDTICKNCYSFALLMGMRKNMQECLERNSQLLSESVLPEFGIAFNNAKIFENCESWGKYKHDSRYQYL